MEKNKNGKVYTGLRNISPALSCVYELTPGKNNDNAILYIFNTDEEARAFWENGDWSRDDGYWFLMESHKHYKLPEWNENCRIVCSEPIWLYVSHYNGCENETICTTSLLNQFVIDESKNPYFERAELFRDFVVYKT